MTPISGLPLTPLPMPQMGGLQGPAQAGGQPFKNILVEALNQVNSMQTEANEAVQQLVTGGDVNPAEVLTAVQKADLAFRLTMQMRNKLMDVYQEIKDIRI